VTSKHVAELTDEIHLLYQENDKEAAVFSGEWIRTNSDFEKMKAPACNIDLAVLHLGESPIHPQYRFLSITNLSPPDIVPGGIRCIAIGYPAGKNMTHPKSPYTQANQVSFELATIEPERYHGLGLDPRFHLAIKHDGEVVTRQGQTVRLPNMKGMSSGPMWIETDAGFVLTAFTSDHDMPAHVVFGTRAIFAEMAVSEYLQFQNRS